MIGCLVNALAQALWLSRIQASPAYVTHLLPAQLLGGAGVGLTIPSLLGAGSAGLAPGRFGTGSGILNMGRQIGTVLGVAGLVAILSRVSAADPVPAYRNGLVLVIAFFAAAGVVCRGAAGRPGGRGAAGSRCGRRGGRGRRGWCGRGGERHGRPGGGGPGRRGERGSIRLIRCGGG